MNSWRAMMEKLRIKISSVPDIIVLGLIVLYAAFFSFLSLRSIDSLASGGYDLAIFDQVIWGTARGGFYPSTLMSDTTSLLGHHFSPILLSLIPLYWTWSDFRVLLVAQSMILSFGAFPIYWLARERLSAWHGIAFVAAYLLFPPLQAGNLFDFHEVAFSVPLLTLTFWLLLRRNYIGFSGCAFLSMLVKEEVSLLVIMLGLYAILAQRKWRLGLAWMAVGAFYFTLVVYTIIPGIQGGTVHPFLYYFSAFGKTPIEIAWNVVTNPAHTLQQLGPGWSFQYLADLLFPFGFLSLFAPLELALFLPQLAINLLSNTIITHRLMAQYPLNLIPFVTISAVVGAGRIVQWLGRRRVPLNFARGTVTGLVLVGSLVAQREHGLTPLSRQYTDYSVSPHAQLAPKFAAKIPHDASVWAQLNLLSFLSHHDRLYTWELFQNVDYIFIDVATAENFENANQLVRDVLMPDYHIVVANDGYLLLARGPGNRQLPSQFYTFAYTEKPATEIQHRVTAKFGDAIEFLGYDSNIHEWEFNDEPKFTFYFRALRKLDKDYWIKPYLIDSNGQPIGSTDWQQAIPVWFPTSRWEPGKIVRVQANTFTWWTGNMRNYSVALGILDGDDSWNSSLRLVPHNVQSPYVIALPGDGTLLQLATFSNDLLMRRQLVPEPHLYALPSEAIKTDAHFGETISLRGYRIEQAHNKDGKETLRLTLYWQLTTPLSTRYTVFAHVLNANGELIAQHDGQPNHGNTPTNVWLANEIIADAHEIVLPDGVSYDKVTIQVGMYNPVTGVRLSTTDASDAVTLGK